MNDYVKDFVNSNNFMKKYNYLKNIFFIFIKRKNIKY